MDRNQKKRITSFDELFRAYKLDSFVKDTDVLKTDNTTAYTPTANYHPATKKYVDDNVAAGGVSSVNSQTGAVVLDTDDISEGTNNKYVTAAQKANFHAPNSDNQDLSGYSLTSHNHDLTYAPISHNQSADTITDGTTNKAYTATEQTKLSGIADNANNYSLPTASDSVLGGVKVDGATITIASGVISAATGGSGDVTGPASSTDNHVVFFNSTSGKVIKDSGLTLSGSNTGDQDITGKLDISKIGVELWSGTWTTGDITVNNIDNYKLLMILQQAPCLAYNMGTYIMGVQGYTSSTTHYTYQFYCTKSGTTLTYSGSSRIAHTSGSTHGTATTGSTVTKIYGLL